MYLGLQILLLHSLYHKHFVLLQVHYYKNISDVKCILFDLFTNATWNFKVVTYSSTNIFPGSNYKSFKTLERKANRRIKSLIGKQESKRDNKKYNKERSEQRNKVLEWFLQATYTYHIPTCSVSIFLLKGRERTVKRYKLCKLNTSQITFPIFIMVIAIVE